MNYRGFYFEGDKALIFLTIKGRKGNSVKTVAYQDVKSVAKTGKGTVTVELYGGEKLKFRGKENDKLVANFEEVLGIIAGR